MTAAVLLFIALMGTPASADEQAFVAALDAGRAPSAGLAALDEHLAFERALEAVLLHPSEHTPALVDQLLACSPLRVPRSFTDGRQPTGWDLAQGVATAQLAARRPELAGPLERATTLLSPEVWTIAEGLTALDELVAAAGDEPVVSALLFQTADRLAPFPHHHAALAPVLAHGVQVAPGDHQRRLAELRLACGARTGAREPDAAPLWDAVARSAPSAQVADLTALAAATAAGRAGDAVWRVGARERLRQLVQEAADAELAERALVRLVLSAPTPGEALRDVVALADAGARPERVDGLLLVLVRDRPVPFGSDVLPGLQAELEAALARATGDERRPCLLWAASELARDQAHAAADHGTPRPDGVPRPDGAGGGHGPGLDPAARALLVQAAGPALAGAQPRPVLSPRSEWWLPIDEVPERSLRPVEYARAACWSLADDAWQRQAWEDVLTYGAVPVPAQGCGNAVAASERLRLSRRARALEALGRLDEALDQHVVLLRLSGPRDELLLAAFDLAGFARRADRERQCLDGLTRLPGEAAAQAELTRRLLTLGRMLDERRQDEATVAAAAALELLEDQPVLTGRLSAWLAGER